MSELKFFRSETILKNGVELTVYIPAPQKITPDMMGFVEKILLQKYFKAADDMILYYEKRNILPIRYINNQQITIQPFAKSNEYGKLLSNGRILLDNDAFCGVIGRYSRNFIFGSMIGYKIIATKEPEELLQKIKKTIPTINGLFYINRLWAEKILSDLTGEIVSGEEPRDLFWIEKKDRKYIQQEILKIAWI